MPHQTKYGLIYENPGEAPREADKVLSTVISAYEGAIPRVGETIRITTAEKFPQDYVVTRVVYPLGNDGRNDFLEADFPQVTLKKKRESKLAALCRSLFSRGTPSS
jgi:hypothetical protein